MSYCWVQWKADAMSLTMMLCRSHTDERRRGRIITKTLDFASVHPLFKFLVCKIKIKHSFP